MVALAAEYFDNLNLRLRRDAKEKVEEDDDDDDDVEDEIYEFENEDSDRPRSKRDTAHGDEIQNDVNDLNYRLKWVSDANGMLNFVNNKNNETNFLEFQIRHEQSSCCIWFENVRQWHQVQNIGRN